MRLLVVAAATGLAANWLRVFSLIVIGYASDMQNYLVRVDHLTYGWILFLVCMWPVFWYGARLERRGVRMSLPSNAVAHATPPAWQTLLAGALVASLLTVPRVAENFFAKADLNPRQPSPMVSGGLQPGTRTAFGELTHLDSVIEEQASSEAAGGKVWIYRATARNRASRTKWPTDASALLGGSWHASGQGIPEAGGIAGLSFFQYRGKLSGVDVVLRTGSLVAGRPVESRMDVKLANLQGLLKQRSDAVLWMVAAPCDPDCAAAARLMDEWLSGNLPLLRVR
jgi:hypothetical protein